jgi:L-amino acid N-acyltransferase YncA
MFEQDVVLIRCAQKTDLEAITEIYNEAVRTTTATFDTEPKTVEERRGWFMSHGERHPILVAEFDGSVVGWGCLTRWSDRPAYDVTAETSFYVKQEHRGKGIGRKLKQATIDKARQLGFHSLIARIAEGSAESLHLNEAFGFQRVGTLKEVGRKFGRLLDVHILQLILD